MFDSVLIVSFGWWFPEKASSLYDWEKSNINMIISSGPDYDPLTGAVQMRGVPCRVSLAEELKTEDR